MNAHGRWRYRHHDCIGLFAIHSSASAVQIAGSPVRAGGIEADVRLHLVDDPALVDQVTEDYRVKYRSQGSLLLQFLRPPATGRRYNSTRSASPLGIRPRGRRT